MHSRRVTPSLINALEGSKVT